MRAKFKSFPLLTRTLGIWLKVRKRMCFTQHFVVLRNLATLLWQYKNFNNSEVNEKRGKKRAFLYFREALTVEGPKQRPKVVSSQNTMGISRSRLQASHLWFSFACPFFERSFSSVHKSSVYRSANWERKETQRARTADQFKKQKSF